MIMALNEIETTTQPDPQVLSKRELTSAPPNTPAKDAEQETDIKSLAVCSFIISYSSINIFFLTFNKPYNLHDISLYWYYNLIYKVAKSISHLMIKLALLQSGDVHPNPGPLSDLLQIIAEKNHTPTFNIPQIQTFPHQTFDFESFFIDPTAQQIVKERCFNIIYSCSAHPNLNDCFAIFTKFYVKQSIALCNVVTTTITECLLGYRCAFCLKAWNKHKGRFLPDGFVCSPTCESDYMDKFILPYNHSEHRCRAKWIQHLGLRPMNNFGRLPTCKDHFPSEFVCLTLLT